MHRSIFISSTFRDMHFERDAIHMKIIPIINAEAEKLGNSVSACDLRWGVNTSGMEDAESSQKVLNVCLGEIDRCRPYMIVLLGYRYGWIPDEDLISKAVEEKDGFVLDDKEISVTALEIEYGALANTANIGSTLFYFREIDGSYSDEYRPEDVLHKQKLDALKSKIQATPGAHIQTYHVDLCNVEQSMQEFSVMVANDLYTLMKPEWDEDASLDPYAIDQKRQWEYLEEKNAQFLSRENLLQKCRSIIIDEKKDFLIHGKIGSGKSTLISRIGKELSETGVDVVPIFCGYTHLTSSGFDIMQYVVYELERRLGIENHFSEARNEKSSDNQSWSTYLLQLFEIYSSFSQKDLIILIDGIDQLIRDNIVENGSYLPDEDYPHIHFILSMVTEDRMPLERQLEIDDLDEKERAQVVTGILKGKHRELSRDVIDKIIQLPNAKLPLYLNLVIRRLIMMDHDDFHKMADLGEGMDAITQYQLMLINECPNSLEDLSAYIIDHASDQIGGESVKWMGYFLALSRRGLRHSDLENLVNAVILDEDRLHLKMADAAGYVQYMEDW